MRRFMIAQVVLAAWMLGFVTQAKADSAAHQRITASTVWIVRADGGNGSGVLVDAQRRLVVTNAHVVRKDDRVAVFAPVTDTNGKIWERSDYLKDAKRLGDLGYATIGKVIAYYADKDLAVLQLESDLRGLRAIPLAEALPKVDDGLHIVGNPGGRPLFSYAYGGTQSAEREKVTYSDGLFIDAQIIRFSGNPWPGNSGGPVTNKEGRLVGIMSGGGKASGIAIALPEVRRLLDSIRTREVFAVHNKTSAAVHFKVRLGPDREWHSYTLQPNRGLVWSPANAERIEIQFERSANETKAYVLHGNQARLGTWQGRGPSGSISRNYAFERVDGELDLFTAK